MTNQKPQTREINSPPSLKWMVALSAAILIILLTNGIFLFSQSADNRGTFGDMFGFSNALFSGFALLGLVYAILLQRHEVSIAKQEIQHTKTILDEQQKQLEKQNELSEKQAFETTFFNLLSLFSQLTERIDVEIPPTRDFFGNTILGTAKTFTGKDVFPMFSSMIWQDYGDKVINDPDLESCIAPYEAFYSQHNSELGHYFRTLYNILKFVNNSELNDKRLYTNLVRAQLSDAEIEIIFHNGLSKHGLKKFKPLVEKYGLLKNLNKDKVREHKLIDFYDDSAF